jgi:predicted acetyltransferase
MTEIVIPVPLYLPAYEDAVRRGWSPDNVRGAEVAAEVLAAIRVDPDVFLRGFDDPEARGGPIRLPDGSFVPRLPGITRWIWDDGFCGSIGFRWQTGTSALPAHVLGHIGYSVVRWLRGRGYATRALALMLDTARGHGLCYVELTTTPDNPASQKVIIANGGRLVETFRKDAAYGGGEALRFRIDL